MQKTRVSRSIPATATTIDFGSLIFFSSFLLGIFSFFFDALTTGFNFVINLGLFFLGELA